MRALTDDPGARVLESPPEVAELSRQLAGEPLIALDTEADSFHSYYTKVCLVQISTRGMDVIIDPLSAGSLAPLGPILTDPEVTCVLHGSDYDLRILDRDHGLRIRGLFDTMIAARLLGYTSFGLSSLLERHFGLTIPKEHQRADWSKRPLTPDMLRYAVNDTHHLPALHDALQAELAARGRLAWAQEEFALLEEVRHQPRDEEEAFRRIKGAGALDRRGMAVLRAVHGVRERIAQQMDRASFRVLSNATLLELARRRPQDAADLAALKGLPRGRAGRELSGSLLEAVRGAMALAEEDLPSRRRGGKPPREADPDTTSLRQARAEAAAKLELDPGLLAPNALLEAVARARPRNQGELLAVPGMRRWQAEVLGDALIRGVRS